MRTTVTLDDELVEKAKRYTGIKETSQLLKRCLAELVRVEAGRRLIAMGGTMPDLAVAPRRKASATSGASA